MFNQFQPLKQMTGFHSVHWGINSPPSQLKNTNSPLVYFLSKNCKNCNSPLKKVTPLSQQPSSKNGGPVKPPPLSENLLGGSAEKGVHTLL